MTGTIDCAVVGGGIAGIACGRRLKALGLSVVVIEEAQGPGGRLRTKDLKGSRIELGAQFLTSFYDKTLKLLKELEYDELDKMPLSIGYGYGGHVTPVWHPRLLLALLSEGPAGAFAGVIDLLRTLINWQDLQPSEIWRSYRLDTHNVADENVSSAQRVIGERIYGPAMEHFLYWSPATSSRAFVSLLSKGGIILRGVYRPRRGFIDMVWALSRGLDFRFQRRVDSLKTAPEGWLVRTHEGEEFAARSVVIATPGPIARSLTTGFLQPAVQQYLDSVSYTSTIVVTGVLPGVRIPYTTVSNFGVRPVKFSALTLQEAAGGTIFSIFLSSDSALEWMEADDETIVERSLDALAVAFGKVFDFRGTANEFDVHRWRMAVPRFPQGSLSLLAEARESMDQSASTLTLAGDYISGPLIEGAVESGIAAADRIVRALQS